MHNNRCCVPPCPLIQPIKSRNINNIYNILIMVLWLKDDQRGERNWLEKIRTLKQDSDKSTGK